jgi:zinc transport system ATP-binding protein
MTNKLIEISNLNFKNVLRDISLDIFEGDFVALIGPNGGGKSTFIKLLLGILEKSSGNIKLFNKPIDAKTNQNIGYVPQNHTQGDIFPATVDEIIKTAFAYKTTFLKQLSYEENEYIEYLMNKFEISDLKYKLVDELSGGQKQRVMIVRALANRPKLLILDEPDFGVDATSQNILHEVLKELNQKEKVTILFVTHHLELLQSIVTKTFHISQVIS